MSVVAIIIGFCVAFSLGTLFGAAWQAAMARNQQADEQAAGVLRFRRRQRGERVSSDGWEPGRW